MKTIIHLLLLALLLNTSATHAQKRHNQKSVPDTLSQQQLQKFDDYLHKNLTYDKELREEHIHGQVIIAFKIGPDHQTKDISIIKSADTSLSAIVIAVVKNSQPPALRKLGVTYVLPINFNLTGGGLFTEAMNNHPEVTAVEMSKVVSSPVYVFKEVFMRGILRYPGESIVMSDDSFKRMTVHNEIKRIQGDFDSYLNAHIVYPAIDREYKVSGLVIALLSIDANGDLQYLSIAQCPSNSTGQEVFDVIKRAVAVSKIGKGNWVLSVNFSLFMINHDNTQTYIPPNPKAQAEYTQLAGGQKYFIYNPSYISKPEDAKPLIGMEVKGYIKRSPNQM